MVLAFEGNETSIWNCRSQPAPPLERHHCITADVKDKGRHSEFASLITDVEGIESIPKPFGRFCRGAPSLEFANPPELLFGCIGHQQVRKNLAKCSGFLAPAQFNHLRQCMRLLLHALIGAFRISARQVTVISDQPTDALWVE